MRRALFGVAVCIFGLAVSSPAPAQFAAQPDEPLDTGIVEAPETLDPMQDMTIEEQFLALHGAVVAYESCTGLVFGEPEAMLINGRIREIIGQSFGAGRTLELIFEAQHAMNRTLTTQGCRSETVAAAVALFDREFAPALGLPTDSPDN